MAEQTTVTFVPRTDVGSVTLFSEDRGERQKFDAGVPVANVPQAILALIRGAKDNKVNGYAFRVDDPARGVKRPGRGSAGG